MKKQRREPPNRGKVYCTERKQLSPAMEYVAEFSKHYTAPTIATGILYPRKRVTNSSNVQIPAHTGDEKGYNSTLMSKP